MQIKRQAIEVKQYFIEPGDLIYLPDAEAYSLVMKNPENETEFILFDLKDNVNWDQSYNPVHLKNWLKKHHDNYELIKSDYVELIIHEG